MTSETISAVRDALRTAIEEDDCDIAVALAGLLRTACDCEIEGEDGEPDGAGDINDNGTVWVVGDRRLMIDGESVAEWTRCACGTWGEMGRQCSDDEWCVSEDTEGGDSLSETVEAVLDALDLEDSYPDVPAPALATDTYEESADGEYALYWETVGDDGGPRRRYDSLEAAQAVCAQRNREFSARNPCGGGTTMLCCFGVRVLVGGQWVGVEGD